MAQGMPNSPLKSTIQKCQQVSSSLNDKRQVYILRAKFIIKMLMVRGLSCKGSGVEVSNIYGSLINFTYMYAQCNLHQGFKGVLGTRFGALHFKSGPQNLVLFMAFLQAPWGLVSLFAKIGSLTFSLKKTLTQIDKTYILHWEQ